MSVVIFLQLIRSVYTIILMYIQTCALHFMQQNAFICSKDAVVSLRPAKSEASCPNPKLVFCLVGL